VRDLRLSLHQKEKDIEVIRKQLDNANNLNKLLPGSLKKNNTLCDSHADAVRVVPNSGSSDLPVTGINVQLNSSESGHNETRTVTVTENRSSQNTDLHANIQKNIQDIRKKLDGNIDTIVDPSANTNLSPVNESLIAQENEGYKFRGVKAKTRIKRLLMSRVLADGNLDDIITSIKTYARERYVNVTHETALKL
jgi:hypothetical protein